MIAALPNVIILQQFQHYVNIHEIINNLINHAQKGQICGRIKKFR